MSRTPLSTTADQRVTLWQSPLQLSRTWEHTRTMLVTVFTRSHTYNHHFMHTTLNSQKAGYQEEFTLLDPSGPATPVRHTASPFSAHPTALMSSALPSVQPGSMPPDPLNNDTPTTTHDEPDANSLAKAINNLIKSNMSTSRPKLCEPDPFDGFDPHKLQTFILQ